jgi:hypothetical protein
MVLGEPPVSLDDGAKRSLHHQQNKDGVETDPSKALAAQSIKRRLIDE